MLLLKYFGLRTGSLRHGEIGGNMMKERQTILPISSVHLTETEKNRLLKMTKTELAKSEAYLRKVLVRDDPLLLLADGGVLGEATSCLKIKTKGGDIIPF